MLATVLDILEGQLSFQVRTTRFGIPKWFSFDGRGGTLLISDAWYLLHFCNKSWQGFVYLYLVCVTRGYICGVPLLLTPCMSFHASGEAWKFQVYCDHPRPKWHLDCVPRKKARFPWFVEGTCWSFNWVVKAQFDLWKCPENVQQGYCNDILPFVLACYASTTSYRLNASCLHRCP